MNKSIETLSSYDIPTGSYVAAIQYLNDRPSETDAEYLSRIGELVGSVVQLSNEHMPRYTYLYLVQELIRASFSTDTINAEAVYEIAYDRAEEFIKENSYIFATSDDEVSTKVDATGAPKQKKGAKKAQAIAVYADEIEGKNLSRKEAIAIIMDKVGMSSGGASTYYANLKAGRM